MKITKKKQTHTYRGQAGGTNGEREGGRGRIAIRG